MLEHANRIFSPRSAEKLIALGARPEEVAAGTEAAWVTAAASLQPERADAWIRAAYGRVGTARPGHSKATLLVAMFDWGGDAARPWIAEQFWRIADEPFEPPIRDRLVYHLAALGAGEEAERVRARAMLRAIVEQPAFAHYEGLTLVALARALNGWLVAPLVDEDDLQRVERIDQTTAPDAQTHERMADWRKRIAWAAAVVSPATK